MARQNKKGAMMHSCLISEVAKIFGDSFAPTLNSDMCISDVVERKLSKDIQQTFVGTLPDLQTSADHDLQEQWHILKVQGEQHQNQQQDYSSIFYGTGNLLIVHSSVFT